MNVSSKLLFHTSSVRSSSSTLAANAALSSIVARRYRYFFSPWPDENPRPRYPAVGITSSKSQTRDLLRTMPMSSPRSASTFTKSPGMILRGADGARMKLRCALLNCTWMKPWRSWNYSSLCGLKRFVIDLIHISVDRNTRSGNFVRVGRWSHWWQDKTIGRVTGIHSGDVLGATSTVSDSAHRQVIHRSVVICRHVFRKHSKCGIWVTRHRHADWLNM